MIVFGTLVLFKSTMMMNTYWGYKQKFNGNAFGYCHQHGLIEDCKNMLLTWMEDL